MVRYLGTPGQHHQDFADWARAQGVTIDGVAANWCSTGGIGLTASRDIEAGEVIISVPVSAMLTADNIPSSFRAKFKTPIPVHGLMATYLCCDEDARTKYAPWRAVWPSMEDFEETLPLLWPEYLTGRETRRESPLPPPLSGFWRCMYRAPPIDSAGTTSHQRSLLARQEKRLRDAYTAALTAFPDTDWRRFIYHWIAVNTRSFYHVPVGAASPPKDRNDAMALCPFADYFNHSDKDGCEVIYDDTGYTFKASKSYMRGEEIFVTYGNHSTDVLWTEYGFVPKENKWDSLPLDDVILSELEKEGLEQLKEENYSGDYHFTNTGSCFRTDVAATMTYLDTDHWRQYIRGHQPPQFDQWRTNSITAAWIRRYIEEAKASLLKVTELRARLGEDGADPRFHNIVLRWRLIIELADDAIVATVARK